MRLTLRTLLAYLDNVLSPTDAEDLRKRIQESELAGNLVGRIQTSTRRLRLSAPPVEGRGLGADPNSVAEYLDNTLPVESIPELERVCLESDMQLAEVASCHQVLTLLNQPIEVSQRSREQIYAIGKLSGTQLKQSGTQPAGESSDGVIIPRPAGGPGELLRSDRRHPQPPQDFNESNQSAEQGVSSVAGPAAGAISGSGAMKGSNIAESPRDRIGTATSGDVTSTDSAANPNKPIKKSKKRKAWTGEPVDAAAVLIGTDTEVAGQIPVQKIRVDAAHLENSVRIDTIRAGGLGLSKEEWSGEQVPEYLRDQGRAGWQWLLATAALLALLFLVAWRSVGSWDRVVAMLGGANRSVDAVATIDNAKSDAAVSPTLVEPALTQRSGQISAPSTTGSTSDLPSQTSRNGVIASNPSAAANPAATQAAVDRSAESSGGGNVAGTKTLSPENVAPITGDTNLESPDLGDRVGSIAGKLDDRAANNMATPAATLIPSNNGAGANESTGSQPGSQPGSAPLAARWEPATENDKQSVLFGIDSADGQLKRLPGGKEFSVGEVLIVPPSIRTTLNVQPGFSWTICGPTELLMEAPSGNRAKMNVGLCRALIAASTKGRELEISWPGGRGLLLFDDPTSVASLEVRHFPIPGKNPVQAGGSIPSLLIVGAQGGVKWQNLDSENGKTQNSVPLQLGQLLTLLPGREPQVARLQQLPSWFANNGTRPLDDQAMVELGRTLEPGKPCLAEIFDGLSNRRPEIGGAAAACLTMMGDFSWIDGPSGLLNQASFKSYWADLIDLVRLRIGSSPRWAAAAEKSLQAGDPVRGPLLMQLIVGFSEEQLKAGKAEQLVTLLDSQNLDERVLAIYQLRAITGKDHGYQAEMPQRSRIQEWQRRLAAGEISYLQPRQ